MKHLLTFAFFIALSLPAIAAEPRSREDKLRLCADYNARVEKIDSQLRQSHKAAKGNKLSEKRRKVKDQIREARCGGR